MSDDDQERASDLPADLAQEREVFVRSFLKRGFELTEDLLKENSSLRRELENARQTNARLRAQVASDDAIRDLLSKIEDLESEKTTLLRRSDELEKDRNTGQSRFLELETELGDLANLYIAAYQLHQNLSARRVVRHTLDVLGQFVGAYGIVVYVLDSRGALAVPIAYENVDSTPGVVPVGNGPVGEACMTGLMHVPELTPTMISSGSLEVPLAVIPLIVEGRSVGVISIISVLEQKRQWAAVDRELLKLLSERAGVALVSAHLYAHLTSNGPNVGSEASSGEGRPTSGHPAVRALHGLPDSLARRGTTLKPAKAEQ